MEAREVELDAGMDVASEVSGDERGWMDGRGEESIGKVVGVVAAAAQCARQPSKFRDGGVWGSE